MRSIISEKHLIRILNMLKETKGKVTVGGERMTGLSSLDNFDLSEGSFLSPTVISDITLDDILWREEIFGPVVVTKTFEARNTRLRCLILTNYL